ncbi:hypothetical protein [Actinomadura alba]|uniref:Integral membrane protein n=1 Tax=Actinomadura alba TaxID=406431 RepID=A0ABR7LIW3_9ACTN|nr:hypothetical protein [Actinomadura alba]MBC6464777.1 hypothetical protein [Actinomadura alba]
MSALTRTADLTEAVNARVRGRWWRDPYLAVAAVVVLWTVLVTLRHGWAGDFRLHLATVHALSTDLWSPADPLVGAASGSPYYSPYMVLLGAVSALTGAAPQTVLEVAGVVNVVVLLVAVRRFCRHLGGGPLVAALAVVFTLLLWGLRPTEWSGFLGLTSLSWTMSYPSVIGTALMLLLWDAFLRYRSGDRGPRALAVITVLGALLLLTHPFTAANAVIGLVAFAFAGPRTLLRAGTLLGLAGAAGAVVALTLLWPWSDVFSLFGVAGDFDAPHKTLIADVTRSFGFEHYGLALAGLPALVMGGRRPLGRELQILFVLAVSLVAVGALTGSYGFARSIPVVMLPLHLALASYLGGPRGGRTPVRAGYAVVALIACCVGAYGASGGLVRAYWKDVTPQTLTAWGARPVTTSYDPLLPHIGPRDVVITEEPWPSRLVNGRGARAVVTAWPYPFVDEATRRRDAAEFFAAGTGPERRAAIADHYGVTCALLAHRGAAMRPGAVPGFHLKATNGGRVLLCRRCPSARHGVLTDLQSPALVPVQAQRHPAVGRKLNASHGLRS